MSRRVHSLAGVIGAVGAGALSAMLINSPLAYATDPPPVPSFFDFVPPGEMGNATTIEESSIPYLYNFLEQNLPYTIFDHATVVGAYDAKETGGIVGLLPFLGFSDDSQVVTDSTGLAPAVGTEWDRIALATLALPGPAQAFFADSSMSSPDGTSANMVEFFGLVGNYFSTGPMGTLDEVDLFNTWVPILDTQAVGAVSTGLDALGLGGLTDLSTFLSDVPNMF